MSSPDITQFLPLVLKSGKIALQWQNHLTKTFKSDKSIVTQADQEVEELIIRTITGENPEWMVLGEETSGAQNPDFVEKAARGICFVVDPIDGTAPYANGLPTWGVSLGLMENGILTQGIIYLPALGEIFYTKAGKSWLARVDHARSAPVMDEPEALPPAPTDIPRGKMLALSQRVAKRGHYALEAPFQMTGSSVFALAKVAQGCYGAYAAQLHLWDFAAGWPLLKNLGYRMENRKSPGEPDLFGQILKGAGSDKPWHTRDTLVFGPAPEMERLKKGMDEGL